MKRFIVLFIALFLSSFAVSQTTVTFQVTDADSQVWANATYGATLSSIVASNPFITPTTSGSLTAAGGASFTLSAGTYVFRACPLASSTSAGVFGNTQVPCYSTSVAVSGGSQSVTLAPPAIRIPLNVVGIAVKAYSDAEVTTPYQGARYYNLITGSERVYNGTSWLDIGGAIAATLQKAETTTADANVLTFTPASVAGLHRVCFTASVSAATSGVIGWTLSFTDSNGNPQSNVAQSLFQLGTAAPALTFTTSAASNYQACPVIDINAAGANIVVKWVGGGTTTAKVSAWVEKLF